MAYANEPHRPLRQRCKTCALTCSPDLFLRSPRDVKVICFSIWITHNKDVMHSPQLFSLLILRWILLLSVFSLSLTLWFSPVLCMSFPYTPVLLSNRDTHTQNKQQVRRVLTAICRLPAEPGDLMKEKDEFKKSAFYHKYSSWPDTYIFIKSQRKMSISRCTWALTSKH